MSDSPRSVPDWVEALAARARAVDAQPPFSDQSFVDYRLGDRELIAIDQDAAALVSATDAEFVVDPDARGKGIGTTLLENLLASGAQRFWAHGDSPAARALAASHGLVPVRELLHFVGEVGVAASVSGREAGLTPSGREGGLTPSGREAGITPSGREGGLTPSGRVAGLTPSGRVAGLTPSGRVAADEGVGVIETFVPGVDEDEWLALNAKTFATHPEQGSVTRADLDELESETWFSADDFLVLRLDGRMIGYCWLKVEHARGEFYVVGVDPAHHGERLGSRLFDAGLARLSELGIRSAHLYVEGDNLDALRLYRSRGFAQDSIDIQYQRP